MRISGIPGARSVEAESYSRKLGRRIREGYIAKFNREYGDQGGTTPLGFRRNSQPPHRLESDPATIGQAVRIFELYATGTHPFVTLGAELGMAPERVREILAAPIFNGWYRRGKRSREEQRKAAPWRDNPPVSDELWERVQQVRRERSHGGGPHAPDRVDPLGRILYCVCGKYVKATGTDGGGQPVRTHPGDLCEEWQGRKAYRSATWYEPLAAQVQGITLDDRTIAAVTAVLSAPPHRRDELACRRLARRRKDAAAAFANRRITPAELMATITRLDADERALEAEQTPAADTIAAATAVAYLRDLRHAWALADNRSRAGLLQALYARVEVRGPDFVGVTLTPEAERYGLALALPESVCLARPAGFEPAT